MAAPFLHWMVEFIQWFRGTGFPGAVLYAAAYVVATVLLFPGVLLALGAGSLYGAVLGTCIISPASVAGAVAAFLVARYFARDRVMRRLKKYPQAAALDRVMAKNGFKAVVLLRLQPVIPFNMLNYALGLTGIRLHDYVLASWIGMLPATILYVYLGSLITDLSDLLRGRPSAGVAGQALLWTGLLAMAVLVWWLGRLARQSLREEMQAGAQHGYHLHGQD